MVAKISHGMSLYGALAYNYEKVAAGTAEILSGNRMISDRLGLPSNDMRLALLSFENYLLANRNTEKPVLHLSLIHISEPTRPCNLSRMPSWA